MVLEIPAELLYYVLGRKSHVVMNGFDADRSGELYAIAYSKDGRWLASGGLSGRIHLW